MSSEITDRPVSYERALAEHARGIAKSLGVTFPRCMDGEDLECGESDLDHAMQYLAAVKAKSGAILEGLHEGDPDTREFCNTLVATFAVQFANEQ